jgi:hypothetical protein
MRKEMNMEEEPEGRVEVRVALPADVKFVYPILAGQERKRCLCTAMLYDPGKGGGRPGHHSVEGIAILEGVY